MGKLKQKTKKALLFVPILLLTSGFLATITPHVAYADLSTDKSRAGCPGSPFPGPPAPGVDCTKEGGGLSNDCQNNVDTLCGGNPQSNAQCNPGDKNGSNSNFNNALCGDIVQKYLNPVINFLGAGVGIIIVIMVVVGGIQYSTSSGNPQAVEAARNRIINALIALVAWALMFAFIQWLVPGGIFG